MIRLLLYRVLPLGTAIGIFSGALSPLRPALDAFAKAASALAGQTQVGGVDVQPPDLKAALNDVQAPPPPSAQSQSRTGKTLTQLAEQLSQQTNAAAPSDDPYGEKAGARAPKPIALPKP